MKCWICGAEGVTGEHLVKASDIRDYFGKVTQKNPIYTHTKEKRNIPVCSVNSKQFKSAALICRNCNNALTQPYDRAWERLSYYIRDNWGKISKDHQIDLKKVFPGISNKSSIDVHLYFVKLFGCRIIENEVPIDINPLSEAIRNGTPIASVYLKFFVTPASKHKYAGLTKISAVNEDGSTVFASWVYTVGNISVNIIYNTVSRNDRVLRKAWSPLMQSKIIYLRYFRT